MKVIGFFSAKGGVGKTTLTANVATSLKQDLLKKVLIIDTHLLGADLSTHFGIVAPQYNLADVLEDKIKVEEAIIRDPRTGIDLIAGPWKGIAKESLFSKLPKIIKKLKKYDYIVLDTPPWLGKEINPILKIVDEAYVVTTPSATAVIEAKRTVEELEKRKVKVKGIVLNMSIGNVDYYMSPEEIEDYIGKRVVAIIPKDKAVEKASGYGMPVTYAFPNSEAAEEIKKFAYYIEGINKVRIKKKEGILSKIFSIFKRK